MISALRRLFVESWLGRIIAFLIFLAFIGWGVGDIFTSMGSASGDVVAKVGDRKVSATDLARALQSELPRMAQQMGVGDPSQLPEVERAQIAREVLNRLVTQEEVLALADRNGMVVPDGVLRTAVFDLPYFHGSDGKFDRSLFDQRMKQSGMTERRLLDLMRDDLTVRGVLDGLGDAMVVPDPIVQRLIDFDAREHLFDLVRFDAGAMGQPPAPTDAQLRRYYDNHKQSFRTPEFRHAKVVVLSADTVARSIEVPDADLRRFYDFQSQRFHVPETRHLEVLTFQDEAKAGAAAQSWKSGTSWQAIQAQNVDAAAVDLPDTRKSDVPTPELAAAAFSAPQGDIQGPLHAETGWIVFRVVDVKAPHDTGFDEAKGGLRAEIARAQAPQLLSARFARFQDVVAGGGDLDHVPADLGASPAEGALDAQGNTHEGDPAPLPGDDALRHALIARIFSQAKGARPTVVQGPNGSGFAVVVDEIEPGHDKPFDAVKDQVATALAGEAQRHEADIRATALLTKARQSGGIAKAITGTPDAAMLQSGMSFSRVHPAPIPRDVAELLLKTPVGQSAMLQAGNDYFVFTVTGERPASSATEKELGGRLKPEFTDSMHADVSATFVRGLEQHVKPVPNMAVLQRVIDSTGPASSGEAR